MFTRFKWYTYKTSTNKQERKGKAEKQFESLPRVFNSHIFTKIKNDLFSI